MIKTPPKVIECSMADPKQIHYKMLQRYLLGNPDERPPVKSRPVRKSEADEAAGE